MMRIAVVSVLAAAGADIFIVTPVRAEPSVCLTYDVNVNGQGQAGSQCIPG